MHPWVHEQANLAQQPASVGCPGSRHTFTSGDNLCCQRYQQSWECRSPDSHCQARRGCNTYFRVLRVKISFAPRRERTPFAIRHPNPRIILLAMPVYQYACPDCGFEFEKQQKFTDEPIKRCPNCGKKHVYRVVSKVAVTFKGSGWYITDSKSDQAKHSVETRRNESADKVSTDANSASKAPAKTESTASSSSGDKAESKSDAKK